MKFLKKKIRDGNKEGVYLGSGQLNIDALVKVAEQHLGHKPTADDLIELLTKTKTKDKHIKKAQSAFRMLKVFGFNIESLRDQFEGALKE